MSRLIFSPAARNDLEDIYHYIAKENINAAAKFIETIEEKCYLIAGSPYIGKARSQYGPAIRSFPVGNYILFYDPIENGVEILHVFHAKRDIDSIYK